MQDSYEFDPCSIDGSDEISIDNWKPEMRVASVPKSEWRKIQNDGNYNQEPGIDELKKIQMYLKRKYPDHQIMDDFGINCETLKAIKGGRYSPVDGISLDNQSKIYKEFIRIDKKINKIFDALKFLADNVFDEKDSGKRMAFKALIELPRKKSKSVDDGGEEE